MSIRIISGYFTIPGTAAKVLARMLLIRLHVLERCAIWKAQEETRLRIGKLVDEEKDLIRECARQALYERWQEEWDTAKDRRWTHALIPKIKEWITREHGEIDYWVTQCLSGHGCYGEYLAKRGFKIDSSCQLCGTEIDNVEHAILSVQYMNKI